MKVKMKKKRMMNVLKVKMKLSRETINHQQLTLIIRRRKRRGLVASLSTTTRGIKIFKPRKSEREELQTQTLTTF